MRDSFDASPIEHEAAGVASTGPVTNSVLQSQQGDAKEHVGGMGGNLRAHHCARPAMGLMALLLAGSLGACGGIWNDPYPAAERGQNILYSAFVERPKHLDAAQSYGEDEAIIHAQIY